MPFPFDYTAVSPTGVDFIHVYLVGAARYASQALSIT